ncbi:MAG: BatA and WFA domain-containing protein [Planctomycetaceae bacterium]|nr:BatA and WFA domain-containing protein [Planctomycetaceae bacterium]
MLSLSTASLLLGGLAAVAIPVLLHLLMQGKPKEIEFPAVMFILQKIETHRRNYRLKHILLLAMRALLFSLLGFALAKPILNLGTWTPFAQNPDSLMSQLATSLGSQDAPIAAAIVVDTSLRMNYIAENKTRLEEAQDFARWILRQIPQNSSVAILSGDPESAVFQVDKLAAEGQIDRLRITPQGRPVLEMVQNAAALLAGSEFEQAELYVLTDLSQPGWSLTNLTGSGTAQGLYRQIGAEVFIVDVGVLEPNNSSIQRFSLVPETPIAGAPVQFDVQVAHIGPATTKTVELVILQSPMGALTDVAGSGNAEVVRTSRVVDFPEGESQQSFSMVLSGFESGTLQGKLRFATSDALPVDDQAWFTLSVQPPQRILVFAEPPVRESALFLRYALETIPFAVTERPIADLAGMTMTELQEHQAVVLLDPPSLMPGTWRKLADYASAGFGVATFLGPNADSLSSFNDPAATEVLGAKLVREARNLEGDLWIVPGVSPIFTPFRSVPGWTLDRFPWSAQPVFRYWELGELSHRADVAARFSDNRAAIVTQTLNQGNTVLVTTPISQTAETLGPSELPWNNLTHGEAGWMFLLFAEGIAKHLVGMGSQRSNFSVGEPVVLRPNVPTLPVSCLLGTPQGTTERLTPDPVRREIVIPMTAEMGNYTVRAGGAGQSALNLGFSTNIASGATALQRVDGATLDRHFGEGNYQVVRTPQEMVFGAARGRVGQEIYALIMFLLACLFAAEYVFSNRIYER